MRVLALYTHPPSRTSSAAQLRSWHLLEAVVAEHEVVVVTWTGPHVEPSELAALRGLACEVIALPLGRRSLSPAARARRGARFLLGGVPPFVAAELEERRLHKQSGRRAFEARLRALGGEAAFALVVLGEEAMALAPLACLRVPVVLHRLNVYGRVIGDLYRRRTHRRGRWLLERRRWWAFDRRVMEGVSLSFAPTAECASELAALGYPVEVLSGGVDIRELRTPPSQGRDVVFVGWMGYPPNVDAVRSFVREAWGPIAARFPASTVRIVGRYPAPEVRALASERVVVTGEVPDVVDACEGARVGVVPLRAGMGIKTKTLELMGMGLPVVATSIGAEGIGAGCDDGLIVADEPRGFAAAVAALLEDGGRADRLGRAARRYVERHHRWEAIGAAYRRRLAELVGRPVAEHIAR